jgi:geranylgeranyl diphosphate synthase type II
MGLEEDKVAAVPAPRQPAGSDSRDLEQVPQARAVRERVRAAAVAHAATLDRSRPPTLQELRRHGRVLLRRMGLPESYLRFAMVLLGSALWKERFAAVPFDRRLLLLPHCARPSQSCPAEYDELGLHCAECGACPIAEFKVAAEKLGYQVVVADGTPIALKMIANGQTDSILGVACLDVLEKAFEKLLLAGIPAYAIPLHTGNCKDSTFDEDWLREVLDLHRPELEVRTRSYVALLRATDRMFGRDLAVLLADGRAAGGDVAANDSLAATEALALDFLARGGKRLRPFITLAAYDALHGAPATRGATSDEAGVDDSVRRVALAIEAFHKASLVHDDIEDDDDCRYGRPTLHRRYGVAAAINVGDYLLGLGYRLIGRERQVLGADVVTDVLARLADAHVRLSKGQGAELAWRDDRSRQLRPIDALSIYALKTAPGFEAALYAGLCLAGPADHYDPAIRAFCRYVGVAFQILNDLDDWSGDARNKQRAGGDVLAMRPTLLLAFALEAASAAQREQLRALVAAERRDGSAVTRARQIYEECRVFDQARRLARKYRERARAVAADVQPDELRHLLAFVVDTLLAKVTARHAEDAADPSLPIVVA